MHPLQQWELVSLTHQERLQEADQWRLARQIKTPQSPLSRLRQSLHRLAHPGRPERRLKLAHND